MSRFGRIQKTLTMDILKGYLQNNVIKYCDKLSHKELLDLALFLGGGYYSMEPNIKILDFINTFIGEKSWNEFYDLEIKKSRTAYFSNVKIISSNITELYEYVSYQSLIRNRDEIIDEIKIFKNKLSKQLEDAIVNSYDGDTFYKADGFSNVIDVLSSHNLINLSKYEDE